MHTSVRCLAGVFVEYSLLRYLIVMVNDRYGFLLVCVNILTLIQHSASLRSLKVANFKAGRYLLDIVSLYSKNI